MTVSKTVGVGSNPAVPAKNFEIMIDWNKLIKCFGIVITAFTFLGCLFVGALTYPIVTTILFGIISIIALTWVLYKAL